MTSWLLLETGARCWGDTPPDDLKKLGAQNREASWGTRGVSFRMVISLHSHSAAPGVQQFAVFLPRKKHVYLSTEIAKMCQKLPDAARRDNHVSKMHIFFHTGLSPSDLKKKTRSSAETLGATSSPRIKVWRRWSPVENGEHDPPSLGNRPTYAACPPCQTTKVPLPNGTSHNNMELLVTSWLWWPYILALCVRP